MDLVRAARYDVLRSQELQIEISREDIVVAEHLFQLLVVADLLSDSSDGVLLNLSSEGLLDAGHGWMRRLGHDVSEDLTMHVLQSPLPEEVYSLVDCLRANFVDLARAHRLQIDDLFEEGLSLVERPTQLKLF